MSDKAPRLLRAEGDNRVSEFFPEAQFAYRTIATFENTEDRDFFLAMASVVGDYTIRVVYPVNGANGEWGVECSGIRFTGRSLAEVLKVVRAESKVG